MASVLLLGLPTGAEEQGQHPRQWCCGVDRGDSGRGVHVESGRTGSAPLLGTQSPHQATPTPEISINPAQNSSKCSQGAGSLCGEYLLEETRSSPHLGTLSCCSLRAGGSREFAASSQQLPKILAKQAWPPQAPPQPLLLDFCLP